MLNALVRVDIGGAFVPGALIVVMAIMLDRTTTAASERGELVARGGGEDPRPRLLVLAVAGVVAAGRDLALALLQSGPPSSPRTTSGRPGRGPGRTTSPTGWSTPSAASPSAIKDGVTNGLLNPLQALLAESPWYVAALAIAARLRLRRSSRALPPTVVCLAGIRLLDLWNDAMVTLTMTLVATLIVMALALVFGVWMARSRASTWCCGRCSTPARPSRRSST